MSHTDGITDPIFKAVKKYEKHPSIICIKNAHLNKTFSINVVTLDNIKTEIRRLNPTKSVQETDIPTKIIKENLDVFSSFICENFNDSVMRSVFPNRLKLAEVRPIFKKNDRTEKSNY